MTRHEVATNAEIRAILRRATDLLDARSDPLDYARQSDGGTWVAIEALRFCALASGELGDPSLADLVFEIIVRLRDFKRGAWEHDDVANHALSRLLRAGLKVDGRVREVVETGDASLRETVASALRPRADAERLLLSELAADPVPAVRAAAKKSLASMADVPWWTGKWKSDPGVRLLAGEAEAVGPALQRASDLLDRAQGWNVPAEVWTGLHAALDELPDELAVEAIELSCHAVEQRMQDGTAALLARMIERRGGVEAFARLIARWGPTEHGLGLDAPLARILVDAQETTRMAICRRLLALVAAARAEDRGIHARSPASLAGKIVAAAWPPHAGIREVLDVLRSPGDEDSADDPSDWPRRWLADALTLPGVDPTPVLDELIEARVSGYPGAWRHFWWKANKLLEKAPEEVLRRTAERALLRDDASTIRWAADWLLGALYRPETDGEPFDRVEAMLSDPGRRAALLSNHGFVQRALPVLRLRLRRGELSYPEAAATMEGIGVLYGGLANAGFPMHLLSGKRKGSDATKTKKKPRRERAAKGPFAGPRALRGPPRKREWEALRLARASHASGDIEERATLWKRTLSCGPWTAEERADLDAFFALFREGHTEALGLALGSALAAKPEPELMPRLNEVVSRADEDSRGLLQMLRDAARRKLGLATEADEAASEEASPEAEGGSSGEGDGEDELPGGGWGDEDEDG